MGQSVGLTNSFTLSRYNFKARLETVLKGGINPSLPVEKTSGYLLSFIYPFIV